MAEFTDYLYCETYPYVTPTEMLQCCRNAEGMLETDARVLDAIEDASTVLYYLTGKHFNGTCTSTVRPQCLSGMCSCGCSPSRVNIGLWPVTELTSVRYGGVTVTGSDLAGTYHIDEHHWLVRNDGLPFISGNQYALTGGPHDNASDGFVFEVTVQHGITPPRLLKRAARDLACEFITACCSDQPCKLPDRVTSVVRSGVSMDIASTMDMLREGRTGIYTVDLAIQVFNPSKLQSPSFIWSAQLTPRGSRVGI